MKGRRRSLIARLIRLQVMAVAVTWVTLLSWMFYQMSVVENGDLDRRMLSLATTLAETAAGSQSKPQEIPARLKAVEKIFVSGVVETLDEVDPYIATYQVLNQRNEVIYSEGTTPQGAWLNRLGFSNAKFLGHHYRLVRTESYDSSVSVIVAESDAMRRASLLPILAMVGGTEMTLLLISVLVLWWAAHRSFAPVRRLASEVERRTEGDLTPINHHIGYLEIAPLIESFNGLLARESIRFDLERGFLADAAHELRTPIAAISAQAHSLIAAPDAQAREQAEDQLQQGVQRVSHLLVQLLTTARLDATQVFSSLEALDLAELLRRRVASFVPIARRKAIDITLDCPEAVTIEANALGLTSIVDNLVDNAIRYTPEGGTILVTVGLLDDQVELAVKDTGPGIAPELHERVFERFYRVPGGAADGSGLGLAIVKKLAQAYGSSIRLGQGLGGKGLSVTLKFSGNRTASSSP